MGHSRFLVILLVSSLLFLSVGHGFGRVAPQMETSKLKHGYDYLGIQLGPAKLRIGTVAEIMGVNDYSEPEPNINPKNGYIFSPPSPVPASPPHS